MNSTATGGLKPIALQHSSTLRPLKTKGKKRRKKGVRGNSTAHTLFCLNGVAIIIWAYFHDNKSGSEGILVSKPIEIAVLSPRASMFLLSPHVGTLHWYV
jgi:hypothetical protein